LKNIRAISKIWLSPDLINTIQSRKYKEASKKVKFGSHLQLINPSRNKSAILKMPECLWLDIYDFLDEKTFRYAVPMISLYFAKIFF
jgi:hypothetical protein